MMQRRTLLGLAVGAGAAGAGMWWAARRGSAGAADAPSAPPLSAVVPDARGGAVDLWAQRFERPEGGELVLASLRGKPTVLNFWATWCPPCVKEMPELDRFARDFATRGWQVVGIAVDSPTPVREFLQKTPVSFPIGLAGFGGTELARALGNTAGGLPFSVALDAAGTVVQRKLGATDYAELARWAV